MIGTTGLYVADMVASDMLWPAFAKWGMGDLLGIISVAPTVFLLTTQPSTNPDQPLNGEYAKLREKIIWSILLFSTYALVFIGGSSGSDYALGLSSLPIALIIWSAIRFQPVWTTAGITLTILILTSMTGFGMAGFKPPDELLDAALLLIFLCLISIIPLVLVAAHHENRIATRKMIRRATTDSATGLANRTAFEEATRDALGRSGLPQTLAYLDLDHFTLVNDTASHAAGDELLQGISSLLVTKLHAGDRLFRIGGDEFALLLLCEGKEAELRCQRILHDIEAFRIGWASNMISTTASIGMVTLRPGQSEFAALLSQADAACFTAKELGGNRVFISSQTETQSQDRTEAMRWAVRIREALNQNLFEIDCQTITSLKNPTDSGRYFEVLVRMRDPKTQQRLLPGYFIPAAERFHLGTQIDRHVVELVLNWMEKHPEAAETVKGCSINLTAASMV
ncbi:MAG: diguanylate cyclase, partial [Methylococcales bacterium]